MKDNMATTNVCTSIAGIDKKFQKKLLRYNLQMYKDNKYTSEKIRCNRGFFSSCL